MIDLAIIGGGPGGYVAAERAGAKGLNVVLFEKRELGGVCLNEGCIPTKTLLYSAKVYDYAKHGDKYGVSAPGATFDFGKIVERKNKVVKKLVGGVGSAMKANKVRVVRGEAKVKGRSQNGIEIECAGETFYAVNLLLCTGSEAFVPPIPGVKEAGDIIVTNREILDLKEHPKSLVIIGGGVIGMEFASFFNSLGTEVTVVEMLPKILGGLDGEISAMLQDIYLTKHYRKIYDAEDAVRLQKALEQERIEAEKERIRAARRAANPEGITENTSKKKQQLRERQGREAAAKDFEAKKRAAAGLAPEEAAEVLSGDPERPFSRGRAYSSEHYTKNEENE